MFPIFMKEMSFKKVKLNQTQLIQTKLSRLDFVPHLGRLLDMPYADD